MIVIPARQLKLIAATNVSKANPTSVQIETGNVVNYMIAVDNLSTKDPGCARMHVTNIKTDVVKHAVRFMARAIQINALLISFYLKK